MRLGVWCLGEVLVTGGFQESGLPVWVSLAEQWGSIRHRYFRLCIRSAKMWFFESKMKGWCGV